MYCRLYNLSTTGEITPNTPFCNLVYLIDKKCHTSSGNHEYCKVHIFKDCLYNTNDVVPEWLRGVIRMFAFDYHLRSACASSSLVDVEIFFLRVFPML